MLQCRAQRRWIAHSKQPAICATSGSTGVRRIISSSLHLFYSLNTNSWTLYVLSFPSPPLVSEIHGDFLDPPKKDPIRTLAEDETVLPCRYQPTADNVVVQVTWYKEKPDSTKDQIITAHHTNGQTGQLSAWSSHDHFTSSDTHLQMFFWRISSPWITSPFRAVRNSSHSHWTNFLVILQVDLTFWFDKCWLELSFLCS